MTVVPVRDWRRRESEELGHVTKPQPVHRQITIKSDQSEELEIASMADARALFMCCRLEDLLCFRLIELP